MTQKRTNIIRYLKNYGQLSVNSLPLRTKQQLRSSYIEKISNKSENKMTIYYQISKYQRNYCKLSANSLTMITKQEFTINYMAEIRI